MLAGYHTRWVQEQERIAIREALAFGKAVYDQRIEEGGTGPTIALLQRLAAALDSDVRLTAGHGLGSVWFEPTPPDLITRA